MTWRDYLIMLLHVGSELEHGLMVQYLYAAYSLGGDHLSESDQDEVREWQDLILTVAREEMGHLLTVQNLLCLLGGPISFDREEFPWDTPFYPFPFNFEPLTRESLAKYIFAEMPGNFDTLEACYRGAREGTENAHFRDVDIPFIEGAMMGWIEENDARPVGEVYQLIIDILSNPDLIPDSELRPETYPLQASWDDWGRGYRPNPAPPCGGGLDPDAGKQKPDAGKPEAEDEEGKPDEAKMRGKANVLIERAATRTDALHALREIAGQGEHAELRLPGGEEPSHFERFVDVLERFDRKVEASKDWTPSRPVPINPTTTSSPDPQAPPPNGTLITHPASAKWADLFNCRYRMLLTFLTHTFRLARVVDPDEPNTRGALMHRIFGEMYNLKTIAGILVRMPLTTDPDDERRAGPPFQMPYSLVLPPDEIDCWRLHRDMFANSKALCGAVLDPTILPTTDYLEQDLLASTPPEGADFLRALRNADENAIAWVDTVLSGLRETGGHHS